MPLFELQRIWDAWPNIYNHQVLRELFRQISTPSVEADGDTCHVIDDVTVIPGHVFVSTLPKQSSLTDEINDGMAQLYAFSRVPLREEPTSHDHHMTPYLLPLNNQCKRVINVIDLTVGTSQRILVLQDCGILSSFEYNSTKFAWELREEIPFSSTTDYSVHEATLHTPTSKLVFVEHPHTPHTSHSSQVTVRLLDYPSNGSVDLGPPKVILRNSPPFKLTCFEEGIALLPTTTPYPKGLLLFWTPAVPGELSAMVWGSHRTLPSLLVGVASRTTSFKTLTLRLAGYWSKDLSGPSLVSVDTNSHTGQLLALASDGTVHSISVNKQGLIGTSQLTRLSDFAQRNPSPSDIFTAPHLYTTPHLFCVHTYFGYCLKGVLRIYDKFTGEFVWECDDHEGMGSMLWTTPTTPEFCGVHGNNGLWLLRSHKIVDHAHFMATALFPIATNADETTPGEYLDSGQLLAAKLSQLWNLHLLVTRYSLEGVFDVVKANVDENESAVKESFLPQPHHELIRLLSENSALQNPALIVALLAGYPEFRQQLSECVGTFLNRYHSNGSSDKDLLTPLNADIVPLLEEFLQLCHEFESGLEQLEQPNDGGGSVDVRAELCKLLKSSESESVSDGEVEASSRALFHSLCARDTEQALLGIRDFFDVDNFEKAIEELEAGSWSSTRNWRGILATESAVRIQRSYMRATTNHLPLFEETCRLLYRTHPSDLLPFVTFAQLVRDFQAQGDSAFARKCRKNFFFHRALNALPMFVSLKTTPTSKEAIQARCQLLLRSDYLNAHMSCLQLLLSNKLWLDAITLVEELKNEESSHCALFHCLLVSLANNGVLLEHLDRLWTLIPNKFSVFDFVGALKMAVRGGEEDTPLVAEDVHHLTVASIGSKVLDLLKQTNLEHLNR
ncbi:uncharacterized protein LOC135336444 isoform X2 [Halichondria panicea]|uniref:uncharacterized protein LOC135336444 isoform X2 n=1 Tax=Halichondria panicea TaxID=6063 RepID=UPI00312B813E